MVVVTRVIPVVILLAVSCVSPPKPWTPDQKSMAEDLVPDRSLEETTLEIFVTDTKDVDPPDGVLDGVHEDQMEDKLSDVIEDLAEDTPSDIPTDVSPDIIPDTKPEIVEDLQDSKPEDTPVELDSSDIAEDDGPCIADCNGKDCGPDGCDGSCGECDDSNACTEDTCAVEGACVFADTSSQCNDNIDCTTDSCDQQLGCLYSPNNNLCNDSNPCTDDACVPETGCTNMPNLLECDDINPCTLSDLCADGVCLGTPYSCDDLLDCTDDTCDGIGGCEHLLAAEWCVINNECIAAETLSSDNPCLACLPAENTADYVALADGIGCNDGEPCTVEDSCLDGACGGVPNNCDDGTSCTTNWCEDGIGCQLSPVENGTECDDGESCLLGDQCTDGICESGDVFNACDDNNDCTTDTCKLKIGCQNTPVDDGSDCSDNDACTLGDICDAGECVTNAVPDCNDGIWCSTDFCDSNIGCVHGLAEACLSDDDDWDNDGLPNLADKCPYAFDPGNPDWNSIPGPDGCESLDDHGDFQFYYELDLVTDDPPTSRRTHEPVELLPTNGWLDGTVAGIWDVIANVTTLKAGAYYGTTEAIAVSADSGTFGDDDQAMKFTGNNAHIILSHDGNLEPEAGDSFTVMTWFKAKKFSLDPMTLFSNSLQYGSTQDEWQLWSGINLRLGEGCFYPDNYPQEKQTVANGGRLFFSLGYSTDCQSVSSETFVADGEWHHVAAVLDGESVLLYVDGFREAQSTRETDLKTYGSSVNIGAYSGYNTYSSKEQYHQFFDGTMDDFVVFNRALSDDDIWNYVNSNAPYGTEFFASPAGDFSDVRLTETPGPGESGPEVVKKFEVLTQIGRAHV